MILLAGLALRLALAPLGAHPGDLPVLTRWAVALNERGYLGVYLASDANYPPLALLLIGGSGWVYGLASSGAPSGPLWLLTLKLPAILADLAVMLLLARRVGGKRRALWLIASLAFNPAMLVMSAWWGQLDSVYVAFTLLAVLAASGGQPLWAGVALGAGVMVKLQAAAVAPVVLLATIRPPSLPTRPRGRLVRLALGTALPVALGLGPFVLTGQAELVLRRIVVALVGAPGWPTVNALNLWYLLTAGKGNWAYNAPLTWPDTSPLVMGLSARTLGMLMLLLWSASVLWLAWRKRRAGAMTWLLAGAILFLGIFLYLTQAHERYALGAVVWMAGAAALPGLVTHPQSASRLTGLYALITLAHSLNLAWAVLTSPACFAGQFVPGVGVALAIFAAAAWGWVALWRGPGARF